MIVARELLVSSLRAIAAYAGVLILPSKTGKWKAAVQMFTVSYYMFLTVLQLNSIPESLSVIGEISIWIALLLTVISGFHYFWRNRSVLQRLSM